MYFLIPCPNDCVQKDKNVRTCNCDRYTVLLMQYHNEYLVEWNRKDFQRQNFDHINEKIHAVVGWTGIGPVLKEWTPHGGIGNPRPLKIECYRKLLKNPKQWHFKGVMATAADSGNFWSGWKGLDNYAWMDLEVKRFFFSLNLCHLINNEYLLWKNLSPSKPE